MILPQEQCRLLEIIQSVSKKDRPNHLPAQQAFGTLIAHYQEIIFNFAQPLQGQLSLVDLIQAGKSGLLIAINKFDPSLGTQFSDHAPYWIRRRMLQAVIQSGTITLPVHMTDRMKQSRQTLKMAIANSLSSPDKIKNRRAIIIRLRLGLVDNYPRSLEEVGQILGFTKEKVYQQQVEALRILRQWFRQKGMVFDDPWEITLLSRPAKILG